MAKKKLSVDVLFYRSREVPGITIRLDVWHLAQSFTTMGNAMY